MTVELEGKANFNFNWNLSIGILKHNIYKPSVLVHKTHDYLVAGSDNKLHTLPLVLSHSTQRMKSLYAQKNLCFSPKSNL